MHSIDIYRDNLFLFGIKPEKDSAQVKRIMGENELRINFIENQYINFSIGDKTTAFNEAYYLNTMPVVTKQASNRYLYQMTLQSARSILGKVQFMFLGDDNSLKEGVFSLTGTAADFVTLVIRNTRRLMPFFEFTAGQIISTDYKTLSFDSENCLDALLKVCEAFETEIWVEGTVISLTKRGRDTGYTFKHGQKKGLYEIVRQTVDNENVVTRLFAFGSDKNLPENYRNFSRRLKLPAQPSTTITNITWTIVHNGDGTQTITFNFSPPDVPTVALTIKRRPLGSSDNFSEQSTGAYISPRVLTIPEGEWEFVFQTQTPTGPGNTSFPVATNSAQPALPDSGDILWIEKNISIYGLSEATVVFDDIFPHRTGTVTSVDAGNFYRFHDTAIDFNVNDYLLPGMTAKVTFNTGQLSGFTFDISVFDNGLKRFTILKNKNERAIEVPSFDFKPAIGDKYVLTDIKMPDSYINAAEAELLARAQALLDKISVPQLAYQLTFDSVYLRDKGYTIDIGDLIWIVDIPLQVQKKMRVVSATRNIVDEYQYSIEVADELSQSKIQALTSGQGSLNDSVSNINTSLQNNSILNNRVVGDLIITDQSSIQFEDLQSGTGLTAIGVDSSGRIYKM